MPNPSDPSVQPVESSRVQPEPRPAPIEGSFPSFTEIERDVVKSRVQSYDPFTTSERLREAIEERVGAQVVGRGHLLRQTRYALATANHVLISGAKGLGKSLFAQAVATQFKGATVFHTTMTRDTKPDEIIGGLKIKDLTEGRYVRNVDGLIVPAHLAFLNEIYDAPDMTLRSLLDILHERKFNRGDMNVRSNLHSALATTNYVRHSIATSAFNDRLIFKTDVQRPEDMYELSRIGKAHERYRGKPAPISPQDQIPFDEIIALSLTIDNQNPSCQVTIPPHLRLMRDALVLAYEAELKKQATSEDIKTSSRTAVRADDVLRAAALTRKSLSADVSDLAELRFLFPVGGTPQVEVFDQVHKKIVNEITPNDRTVCDSLSELDDKVDAIIDHLRRGQGFAPSILERIGLLLHITTKGRLTFGEVIAAVGRQKPQSDPVTQYRDGFIRRLRQEMARVNKADTFDLFTSAR